ncbi:hypothetical protein O5699_03655 [Escherichia coli]|nr:hypothetical protein [Escherichia coli]
MSGRFPLPVIQDHPRAGRHKPQVNGDAVPLPTAGGVNDHTGTGTDGVNGLLVHRLILHQ